MWLILNLMNKSSVALPTTRLCLAPEQSPEKVKQCIIICYLKAVVDHLHDLYATDHIIAKGDKDVICFTQP